MSFDKVLFDSSKAAIDIAVKTIEGKPQLLKDAFRLCFEKYPIAMRAARVVQFYTEKHPEAILPYMHELINELLITQVDGVKRSFLKILIILPDICLQHKSALILDKCLEWLFTDKEPIAVRAYSIDILIKFAMEEPELRNEIRMAIENLSLDDYPSLKVRCSKGLKMMK